MLRLTPFGFRSAIWLVIVFALLGASGCTRSNASAGDSRGTASQSSAKAQSQPASAPSVEPASNATAEVAELQRKADAGDSNAMYRLARLYASGSGVSKDYVEAFDWYKKAAAKGNGEAMYSLGEAYEHGTGVREDVQRAVTWYTDAYHHGSQPAKAALDRLGESYEDHD